MKNVQITSCKLTKIKPPEITLEWDGEDHTTYTVSATGGVCAITKHCQGSSYSLCSLELGTSYTITVFSFDCKQEEQSNPLIYVTPTEDESENNNYVLPTEYYGAPNTYCIYLNSSRTPNSSRSRIVAALFASSKK